jgi:hypothetical protein
MALARASDASKDRQSWKDDPRLDDVVTNHHAGDGLDVEVVMGGVLQAVGGGTHG